MVLVAACGFTNPYIYYAETVPGGIDAFGVLAVFWL
jgi:hypothetical protein